MKAVHWLALGAGAGLGVLAACFTPPDLTGPYKCNQGQCGTPDLSCVEGLCCKLDGGEPPCPPPIIPDGGPPDGGPDGGPDAGPDGGADAGQDAGCTVPMPETCNNMDDDCDGVVDNYPCHGGPPDFLKPSSDYVMGAERTDIGDVFRAHDMCLHGDPMLAVTPEFLDGGRWRGVGATSHFFYAQKVDGGTWGLTRPNQKLLVTFSGAVVQNLNQTKATGGYFQPIVYLCDQSGNWRRFNPASDQVLAVSDAGQFSTSIILDPVTGATQFGAPYGNLLDPPAISRVEVMISLASPFDGGTPAFDAGITTFGFFPP